MLKDLHICFYAVCSCLQDLLVVNLKFMVIPVATRSLLIIDLSNVTQVMGQLRSRNPPG